ncbi:ADP-dependent (S)-NAD(P)H-hydrate dehydratase [Actinoplanes cyaneus]|uniref:ADP-dependent (S)-NAD(P)H-hydrate dehydratase n=1 Tax=Actinoplanes cyaneus TaxID=52696 RepID=A0A919IUA0_9ACTN|nr:NAD(P)H-hydrate dehydratase [Actinoplanes cyaneus]MCW2143619.1 yjeF C-terminal region, hydroxyethylthiazole kinase-related [Actinoplanes cyaneus]GID69748.1 ADP-dependent (S)-NAD(P)H-hydrate dehydratase [Actinoplanes cyaneus]
MPNRPDEQVITPQVLRDWSLPDPGDSKLSRGTVLVIGGSRFNPGAVLLAGEAALRAGAGRLQLAVADEAAISLSIAVPEAKVVGFPSGGGPLPEQVTELAAEADVILIGPGLDDIGQTDALMRQVLDAANPDAGVVLDAYALGALSKDAGLLPQTRAVLTPNLTEAEHLLGREPGDDLAAASRALADRYQAVVSLYGRIAHPDGRVWREESGDAGLGTSGSGDVRAGIVAGLLGRGAEPAQAACWAAFAHAVSGQRLTPRRGRTGFLARELVDEVADTLATV